MELILCHGFQVTLIVVITGQHIRQSFSTHISVSISHVDYTIKPVNCQAINNRT